VFIYTVFNSVKLILEREKEITRITNEMSETTEHIKTHRSLFRLNGYGRD